MHLREKIRESLVALLNTVSTLPTIQTNRATALSESERPAVIVTSGGETVDPNAQYSRGQNRVYTLYITTMVGNTSAVDNDVDESILAIEQSVLSWDFRSVNDNIIDADLVNIDQNITDESSQFIGVATLTYEITYRTQDGNPAVSS